MTWSGPNLAERGILGTEFKFIKNFMNDVILTSEWQNVQIPLYGKLKKFMMSFFNQNTWNFARGLS